VPCNRDYPDLHFMFDRTWLTVDPADYVRDISDGQDGSQCLILITRGGEYPFAVMGLPIYKGYYAVHDDANNRLGFVPHTGSSKNGPYYASVMPSIDLRNANER
jgi:hypothetical protein